MYQVLFKYLHIHITFSFSASSSFLFSVKASFSCQFLDVEVEKEELVLACHQKGSLPQGFFQSYVCQYFKIKENGGGLNKREAGVREKNGW